MWTLIQDTQAVPTSGLTGGFGTIFTLIQASSTPLVIQFKNTGGATVNYKFQSSDDGGTTWSDIDSTDGSVTTTSTDVKTQVINSSDPQVRMVANGPTGVIDFTVQRHYVRASQGAAPLLSL